MRKLLRSIIFSFLAIPAMAQIPAPQINLGGNIGCQGFPCLNSGTLQFTSDANHTMTAQESSATGGIKVTSTVSLTATRNLVLPSGNFQFIAVENATTGGQSIQVIGQSGTGITIANGASATVWFDGTNVVQTGSGTVGSGTAGQIAQYPSSGMTVQGVTLSGPVTVAVGGATTITPTGVTPNTYTNVNTIGVNAAGQVTYAQGAVRVNGCEAQYRIVDSTGTTVPDSCPDTAGSPNNATLGSAAPTLGTFGMLSLPAVGSGTPQIITTPLTDWGTILISFTTWPRGQLQTLATTTTGTGVGGDTANTRPVIWGADVTHGASILTAGGTGSIASVETVSPYVYSSGFGTQAANYFGGNHVLVYVVGSPDIIYMDGLPITLSTSSSSVGKTAVSGTTYSIAGWTSLAVASGFRGWVNYVKVWPSGTALTAAQVLEESNAVAQEVGQRPGYPPAISFNSGSRTNTIICAGDSLMAGFLASTPWCQAPYLHPQNTYNLTQYGIGGQTATEYAALFGQQIGPAIVPSARTILMNEAATNDVAGGMTAADTINSIEQGAKESIAANALVIQATMISRTAQDANKNLINAAEIQNWRQLGLAAINDPAEIPALGANGAYANTNCFQSDGTHLLGPGTTPVCTNGQSSYSIYAQTFTDTINYLDGSTPASPTNVTAYPYTMTYITPVVNATNCTSGTCAITLPGCDHMDDMPFYVMNYGNAGTVTVQPPSSSYYQSTAYNLNGATSAVTVLPNTMMKFNELRGSLSTGGCSWIVDQASYPGAGVPVSTGSAWGTSIPAANIPLLNASNTYGVGTFQHLDNGDYNGTFGAKTNNIATSSANYAAGPFNWTSAVWNGSTSVSDTWSAQPVLGAGANPSTTLVFSHGSSATGPAVFSIPNLTTTVYTVATLPSASSLPAGTQVTVSDDTGLPTSNTCTGSGTEYAIAITNGTSWTCH